jgi:hypothetical protein
MAAEALQNLNRIPESRTMIETKKGQKDVDEPNLVDEEEEEAEHEEARDRIEGVGEEIVTPLSGPAEQAAFDIVEAEVEDYDEPTATRAMTLTETSWKCMIPFKVKTTRETKTAKRPTAIPEFRCRFGQQANGIRS